VEHGYWFARSSEFLGSPLMQRLRWMRAPGDTLFAIGALVLVAFVFTHRRKEQIALAPDALPVTSGD
jgi:nitric oxide reductase subunit B